MNYILHTGTLSHDLAGPVSPFISYGQLRTRIDHLVDHYLAIATLNDRLDELPQQFIQPAPRPWERINWREIQPGQVIGLKLPVFLAIVAGCVNTEAPIRGYTQTSRAYLLPIAPRMAQFVGGIVDGNTGQLVETGLWEKEESRHTPALRKIYRHLSGSQLSLDPHLPRGYKEQDCAIAALYRHGLHRIATEYGATGLYLWLMGHTTGQLQAVFGELLIDEINHTTKFWGFGRWLYPDASFFKTGSSLFAALRQKMQQPQIRGSLIHTLHRMTRTLHWSEWSLANQSLLLYTFGRIMQRFLIWQRGLTHEHLAELFADME